MNDVLVTVDISITLVSLDRISIWLQLRISTMFKSNRASISGLVCVPESHADLRESGGNRLSAELRRRKHIESTAPSDGIVPIRRLLLLNILNATLFIQPDWVSCRERLVVFLIEWQELEGGKGVVYQGEWFSTGGSNH